MYSHVALWSSTHECHHRQTVFNKEKKGNWIQFYKKKSKILNKFWYYWNVLSFVQKKIKKKETLSDKHRVFYFSLFSCFVVVYIPQVISSPTWSWWWSFSFINIITLFIFIFTFFVFLEGVSYFFPRFLRCFWKISFAIIWYFITNNNHEHKKQM